MYLPTEIAQRARIIRALVWMILLLFLWGCKNPFRTRESPPPAAETEGTWKTPSEPADVIQNLFYAYNEMVISNFDRCLCDSFKFSAPEDSIKAVQDNRDELFADWGRSVEVSVTANMFSLFRQRSDSVSLTLLFDPVPPLPDDISDTAAVLLRDYEIYVFDMKAVPAETTLAKGTATFHMEQTSLNWWCIRFWSDVPEVSGGYDWGDFKAQFK
jgi:hypothetical protein